MGDIFKRNFKARWGDMDFNGHMANTAYLNIAGDVRMMYFEEKGFTMRRFEELRLGPVVMKDEIEYFKELRLLEEFQVHQLLAGLSDDGFKFKIKNIFYNSDLKKVAVITSTGGWLDLNKRKLVVPPNDLLNTLQGLVKSDDFEIYQKKYKNNE